MALEAGDCRTRTGLAWLIAEKIMAEEPKFNPNKDKGWLMPNAIAQAIVEHLTAEAEVNTEFPNPPPAPGDIMPGTIT
jgi:hypothetical protein